MTDDNMQSAKKNQDVHRAGFANSTLSSVIRHLSSVEDE